MNETLTINTSQAEFYDDSKSPLTWSQLPPAQCGVNQDCLKCEYDVSNDVIFIEGDFYVVAIVPVSDKNTDNLLTCGDIKGLAGADIAQSVVFAVEEANKKTGMFSVSGQGSRRDQKIKRSRGGRGSFTFVSLEEIMSRKVELGCESWTSFASSSSSTAVQRTLSL